MYLTIPSSFVPTLFPTTLDFGLFFVFQVTVALHSFPFCLFGRFFFEGLFLASNPAAVAMS